MDYLFLDEMRDQAQFDLSGWRGTSEDPRSRPPAREPMGWMNKSRNHRDNDQPWDTAEHRNLDSDEF